MQRQNLLSGILDKDFEEQSPWMHRGYFPHAWRQKLLVWMVIHRLHSSLPHGRAPTPPCRQLFRWQSGDYPVELFRKLKVIMSTYSDDDTGVNSGRLRVFWWPCLPLSMTYWEHIIYFMEWKVSIVFEKLSSMFNSDSTKLLSPTMALMNPVPLYGKA